MSHPSLPAELWSVVGENLRNPQKAQARMVSKLWARLFSAPDTNERQVKEERHARVWGTVLCPSDMDQVWHELKNCDAFNDYKEDEIDLLLIGSDIRDVYDIDKRPGSAQSTVLKALLYIVADGRVLGTCQLPDDLNLQKYLDERRDHFVKRKSSCFNISTKKLISVEDLWAIGTVETCVLFCKKSYDLFTVGMHRMLPRRVEDPKTETRTPGCIISMAIHVRPHIEVYFQGYMPRPYQQEGEIIKEDKRMKRSV